MANNGGCGYTPGIFQPHGEPGYRGFVDFCEIVAHDRLELCFDKFEIFYKSCFFSFSTLVGFFLCIAEQFKNGRVRQVLGAISSAVE